MKRRDLIGIVAVAGALAFGACEQSSRPGSAERGGTTSAPASRGPGGEPGSRAGASGGDRGSAGMASSPSSSSSMDQSGTGGSGDAGYGARDGGMR
jgi:hypothetical protein